MSDLIQEIIHCGLSDVQEHTLDFKILESTHRSQGSVVGKYLIIPLTLSEMNKITKNESVFSDFEDSNISPFFYTLEGDWPWNLYIVFILPDEEYHEFNLNRKMLVERGKRYGRKYIIKRSELSDYLPVAKLKESNQQVHKVNPYEEWNDLLDPAGLTFTMDNYNKESINRFLEEDLVVSRDVKDDIIEPDHDEIKPMIIDSINLGSTYREHCWPTNQTIPFSQVNLLEGANGSGKTSVLEAIELAFTGEISRNKMSDLAESEVWDGKLSYFEGTVKQQMEGQPNSSKQRDREKRYYQYQARERVRTKLLNQFYHRYNYFTSEDIFRHCYKNEKPDFKKEFARVIFGEELSLYEENWIRYKGEFEKGLRRSNDIIEDKKREILGIGTEIEEAHSIISSRLKTTFPLVKNLIQQVWRTYPLYEEDASKTELQKWFEVLYSHISDIEGISRPLKKAIEAGYGHATQLDDQSKKVEASRERLKVTRIELLESEKKLPVVPDLQTRIVEDQTRLSRLEKRERGLNKNLDYLQKNRMLLDDKDKRTRRKAIQQSILTSEKHLLRLEQLQQQWAYLMEFNFEYENKAIADERLLSFQKEQQSLDTELKKVTKQIHTAEEKSDSFKKILAQIKSLGKVYSNEHPEESVCPMCAHDHGTATALQSMMEQDLVQDQQQLIDLRESEHALKTRIENGTSNIGEIRVQLDRLEAVKLAYINLIEHKALLNFSIPAEETPLPFHVIKWLKLISEQNKHLQKEIADRKQEAELLEQNGFTLENIRQLEDMLNTDPMKDLFSEFSSTELFIHALEMGHHRMKEERDLLKEQLESQDLQIKNAKKQREEIQYRKDLIEKEEITNQQQRNLIDQINVLLARLEEKGIYFKNQMLFSQFHTSVIKLNEEVKGVLDLFQNNVNILEKQDKRKELKDKLKVLINQQERCQQALDIMNKLQPLGYYTQEFMTYNISMINDIFLRLHTPQDFERLELNGAEELIAYRKRNDQTIPCNINQMSTGQRTAVILAIFFVMHMSMETAPNILLLDEPVANMDDLNVLALIDFLRQFTLTRNTQIFFTTANPNVSSLFRRKFSILKDRFKAYHIHRMDGEQASIDVKTFLPDKEEGIPVELTN
jgi:exonuclease SbcC